MPARVYSTRFIAAGAANASFKYTVPVGKRAVVRAISGYNGGAAGNAVAVKIGAVTIFLWSSPVGPTALTAELRAVAYEREVIEMYMYNANSSYQVSGHLFEEATGARLTLDRVDGPLEADPGEWP
jgi:hypothetical protein